MKTYTMVRKSKFRACNAEHARLYRRNGPLFQAVEYALDSRRCAYCGRMPEVEFPKIVLTPGVAVGGK